MNNLNLPTFILVSISVPAFRCTECGKLTSSTMHLCGSSKYDIIEEDNLDGDQSLIFA